MCDGEERLVESGDFDTSINGECFGVGLKNAPYTHDGKEYQRVQVQIIAEDDESWFRHGTTFDSAWLQDLITSLEAAKAIVENMSKAKE